MWPFKLNVLKKTTWNLCCNGILSPCLFTASSGRHAYFQSMALACIVLSLVLYSCDDDYYSVADWTWTEFEIIWRPVHDYEMIYIQQWELFMYLHVSDLCIVMQCIMINAYIILSLGNYLPQRFDAFYHLKSKTIFADFTNFHWLRKCGTNVTVR